MAGDIGNGLGWGNVVRPDDNSNCDEAFFGNDELFFPDPLLATFDFARNDIADVLGAWGFRTPWWPKHSGFAGDLAADVAVIDRAPGTRDNVWLLSGANGRYAFAGITRDANGTPLPNCTVRCFRTSTDELVSKVTSDANGYYLATSPYSDAHYLTVHCSTPSSTGGASSDNLTPG